MIRPSAKEVAWVCGGARAGWVWVWVWGLRGGSVAGGEVPRLKGRGLEGRVFVLSDITGASADWCSCCTSRYLMWNHWVARASTPYEPFKDHESGAWVWARLSEHFPEMLAAVLMPNHLHMILPTERSNKSLYKLSGILGALTKRKRMRILWERIPQPREIPDVHHLRRQLRYVALNPCRKKLCSDPLEWYWSTYRELMGATVENVGRAERLARILQESPKNFKVRFHSYVSGDTSVAVLGSPFPQATLAAAWPEKSILEILAACSAALRVPASTVRHKGALRPLFIHVAYQHGWRRQTQLLSQICQMSPRGIQYILKNDPPPGIRAAELCLGDARLTKESMSSARELMRVGGGGGCVAGGRTVAGGEVPRLKGPGLEGRDFVLSDAAGG